VIVRAIRQPFEVLIALLVLAGVARAQPNDPRPVRVPEAEIKAAAAALAAPEVDAAIAAATRLGEVSNRSAIAVLARALEVGLAPRVSLAALESLAGRADSRALGALAVYAQHRRPEHRAAALVALGSVRDRRAEPVIVGGLSDNKIAVRKAAAGAVAARKIRAGISPLLALLDRGDAAAAPALAAIGGADIARKVAERIGQAPDKVIGECLGDMLLRTDFGPDAIRLEVVLALAKIADDVVVEKLTAYVANTPDKPPRRSRAEAERVLGERL
jgi:HEAT repeat protein